MSPDDLLTQRVIDAMRRINEQREQIIEAFLAETGCSPSECEQVVQHTPDGLCWFVRRREEP